MQRDIDRVLVSADRIAQRVRALGEQITCDHLSATESHPAPLTIVPIMTGAMIFCGDLIRNMPVPMKISAITVRSYPGSSIRSQGAKLLGQSIGDLTGRHVLLVDDILDSGGTLRLIVPMLHELGADDVKTCVLLRKDTASARAVTADYVGFDIPDEFVVGYGLDYDDYYRNLPDIVTLKAEVIAASK
ncbi:MAG: hypoxanthine phosphoribosyltransferase [Phycisphaerae bacterium]|nr:hypoxanthine phosphoribosyltransferase [Phycisphaerae bacterium]